MRLGADVIVFSRSPADIGRRHSTSTLVYLTAIATMILVNDFTRMCLVRTLNDNR